MRVRLASRSNNVVEHLGGTRSLNGVDVDADDLAEVPDDTAGFLALAAGLPRFEVVAPGQEGGYLYPRVTETHYTLFFNEDYD